MKYNNKIILLIVAFVFGYGLFYLFSSENELEKSAKHEQKKRTIDKDYKEWNTYRQEKKKIESYKSTEQELKNFDEKRNTFRQKEEKDFNKKFYREERLLIGNKQEHYSNPSIDLPMRNTININWKKSLVKDLFRFQKKSTRVMVKHEKSAIMLYGKKGRYVELVVVNYINANGINNSFRGLVDSETGLLFDTWDKVLREDFTSPVVKHAH